MKVISQIYEVQTPDEAIDMMELGVDHIGSVVLNNNDFLNDENLKKTVDIVKKNGKKSSVIPLFSKFDPIMRLIDHLEPHIIHMCESLTGDSDYNEKKLCDDLAELQFKVKSRNKSLDLMRSIPIIADTATVEDKESSLLKLNFYLPLFSEVSDIFLTDTLFPKGNDKQPVPGFVGITGKICDWDQAAVLIEKSKIPVILAGGLGPKNVYESIIKLKPFGVDSCSNTNLLDEKGESVRFKKDPEKVKTFIQEIKRAEKII